jgi:hypothetical protein
VFGNVEKPPPVAAWPKRLGGFPFWRGAERFLDALQPVYPGASRHGLEIFRGEERTA